MSAKAYAYSRYSSAAQATGDSLKRQLKASQEFADNHGLELDTRHRDLGVSAFTGDNRVRGALGSFIKSVEKGEIERGSYLLIDSMDRLSRESETEVLHLLTGLTRRGIKVVNLAEAHVLDENAQTLDYMRVLIHAARSNQESKEKGRKVREARERNKDRARNGQAWHKTGPAWLKGEATGEGENRRVIFRPVPERVAVVKRIFDMIESGLGTTTIAQRFNEEKVPTFRHGASWQHSAVLGIARSRTVIGEYQPKFAPAGLRGSRRPNDGEAISGYYYEVIDPAQFHRVQAIIEERNRKPRGAHAGVREFTNLFVGIGKCGECRGTIGIHVAHKGQQGRSAALRCGNSARHAPGLLNPNRPCTNKLRYNYPKLEAAALARVSSFRIPTAPPESKPTAALELALAEKVDLEGKVERLLDMLEGGDARMRARYDQRVAELEAKQIEVQRLRATVEQGAVRANPETRQKALGELVRKLEGAMGQELYDLRAATAQAMRDVVDQIDFHPNGDVHFVLAGGLRAFRFRDGEFLDHVDLTGDMLFEEAMRARKGDVATDRQRAMDLRSAVVGNDEKAQERLRRVLKAG